MDRKGAGPRVRSSRVDGWREEAGDGHEPALERRFLRIGAWGLLLLCSVVVVNNAALGVLPGATAVASVGVLASLVILFFERRGASQRVLALVFVAMMVGVVGVGWFPAGGIVSSMSTVFPLVVCIGVLVVPIRQMLPLVLALMGAALVLVGLEAVFPAWVGPQLTGSVAVADFTTAALTGTCLIGLAVRAMRKAYEREREVQRAQRELLSAAHDDLAAALVDARHSNDAKSLFLAHMSHEIRTPLAGVVGRVELLRQEPLGARAREHVEGLARASLHLRRLVDDLLDLGRIDHDRLVPRIAAVEIGALASDAVRDAEEPRGPRFEVRTAPALAGKIRVDPARVRQVLTNLLVNAVRHAEASSVVVEIGAPTPGRLVMTVADDGRGIEPERLTQLFRPFECDERSSLVGGTGLGLYVARRIAVALGGSLEVDSRVGGGTRFRFEVPFEPDAGGEAPTPEAPTPEAPTSVAGLRVLSAEDDPIVREVLAAYFAALGVEAVLVEDGLAAIERAGEASFDAIFLDVNMPGASGLTAAAAIREEAANRGARCPELVALTARAYASDAEACRAAGMRHFLAKPLTLDELRGLLEAVAAARSGPGDSGAVGR